VPKTQLKQTSDINRGIKKFLLSGIVIFAFLAYVLEQRLTNPDGGISSTATTAAPSGSQNGSGSPAIVPGPASSSPFSTSSTPASVQGSYKDGTYTGPQVDVYYGLVEVQATIQNGKLTDVQFLEYPSDRRTSVEINTIAMPYLQQEALQAQNANVDIVSGATLTSQGFELSLQTALSSANK
jgi:uncharacterized protein with FMN-binding domain